MMHKENKKPVEHTRRNGINFGIECVCLVEFQTTRPRMGRKAASSSQDSTLRLQDATPAQNLTSAPHDSKRPPRRPILPARETKSGARKKECRQLLVLIWKHLAVRKRRFIHTVLDLMSPCFFFAIIMLIKTYLLDNEIDLDKEKLMAEVVPLKHLLAPELVVYTPTTPLTSMLMDEAGTKMGLKRLFTFPETWSSGYYGLLNDSLLEVHNLVQTMKDDTAIVIFEDLDDNVWPQKFHYTIRMKTYTDMEKLDKHGSKSEKEEQRADVRDLKKREKTIRNRVARDKIDKPMQRGLHVALSAFAPPSKYNRMLLEAYCTLLRAVCPFSLMLPFVFLLTKLIEERTSGVLELVKQVGVSYDMWAHSHGLNLVFTGLFYATCGTAVCKMSSKPIFPHTNTFLLFLMFVLHFHSTMTFAFVCSFLSKSGDFATTLAVVSYVIICIPARLLDKIQLSRPIKCLTGLFPHVPQLWFWWEVQMLETKEKGLVFKNMSKTHSIYSMSALVALLMMVMQIFIFFYLAAFFEEVCPRKYGTKRPWNYMFKKKDNGTAAALLEQEEEIPKDPKYFEDSQLTNVGIQIEHVTKIFNRKIALSNVSFDVYQGEITILLGHNGAGKTTLMSIITGMLSQTSGNIFVNGIDISKEKTKVQTVIGLCPQHHVFIPDLTVLEHVRFFSMLRGGGCRESYESSKKLLGKLGIQDKMHSKPDELSGGMKRRLQLACALSGGSNVLILDEPTSGLDVETRRELWNLFLSLRGERTVLLSTHFMEEADALGDRVVALHSGKLRCHATPMFLKKNIGTGYRLSLTTTGLPQEQKITSLVTSVIPTATLKEASFNSVSYNLPSQHSDQFPKLFAKLEAKRSKLGVQSIGVGVSSLEEVFLKLCSDVDTKFTEETVDVQLPEQQYVKKSGCILYLRQMAVLIRRQLRYLRYTKYSFLVLQVIFPVGILLFWTYNMREEPEKDEELTLSDMSLDAYGDDYKRTALLQVDSLEARDAIIRLSRHFNNVQFQLTNDLAQTTFQASQNDPSRDVNHTDYFIGIELTNTNIKIMYTTLVRHAASAALNLLSNIIAAEQFPEENGRIITTHSQPLSGSYEPLDVMGSDSPIKLPKPILGCGIWTCVIVVIVFSTLVNAVALPTIEREAGTRHIHLMAGCPPAVHWLATFLTHTLLYTLVLLVPATLFSLIDREHTFSNGTFMAYFFLVLLVGCMAFLFMCYLISFSFSKSTSGLILTSLVVVGGLIPGAVNFSSQVSNTDLGDWAFPCLVPCYLFPPATTFLAAMKTAYVARLNAICNLNVDNCVNLKLFFAENPPSGQYKGFDADKCCMSKRGEMCTLCISEFAPGRELIIMAVQLAVYGTLVIITQYGIFNGLYDRIFNVGYKPAPDRFNDNDVLDEKSYVADKMRESRQELNSGIDAMLVNNLHKRYFKLCQKNCVAVKGISFSLKKGECFGLLGVNGAGKSTTFKMISTEEVTTRGNIYANGYILKGPCSTRYMQSLGYCPQYNGMDEFLTGRENLATVLTLHGLNTNDTITETNTWIEVVGLERYIDVLVGGYSGGCVRRLAAAVALSGGAPVTLLDEPTSGVDVSARRRVWLALRKGLRQNRAVIITSHSMDEMEALCDRIAIMSAGEIAALGSAPALRAKHAAGYALTIKFKSAEPDPQNVQNLKRFINENFNCTLKDEHSTRVSYHINETMQYSEMFTTLEQMKKQFSEYIEDYSINETTLEEVFLSFAHTSPTENETQQERPARKGKKKKKGHN